MISSSKRIHSVSNDVERYNSSSPRTSNLSAESRDALAVPSLENARNEFPFRSEDEVAADIYDEPGVSDLGRFPGSQPIVGEMCITETMPFGNRKQIECTLPSLGPHYMQYEIA